MTSGVPHRSRTALVAALALPLTGGLLAAATPASAAVLQPGNGTVFTVERVIEIRADHPRGASSLSLQAPGGQPVTVASGGNEVTGGVLAYAFETACWRGGAACTGRVPAPNGTWTIAQSGSAQDRISIVLRAPPQTPAGLTATVVEGRQVRLSWQRGAEPDLRGYALAEKGADAEPLPLTVCEDAACSTTVTYPEGRGGERAYALTALRSDGGAGTVESAPAQAAATLPAAPTPSGAAAADGTSPGASPASSAGPAASGGPSAAGSPGASPSGSSGASPGASASASTAAQADRDGLSSRALGPTLGLPGVPPLPAGEGPQVAPLPDGSFAPTLGFPEQEQVLTERFDTVRPGERVTTVVREAVDAERLAQSSAAALLLLLCGAHLQRWLRAGARESQSRPAGGHCAGG